MSSVDKKFFNIFYFLSFLSHFGNFIFLYSVIQDLYSIHPEAAEIRLIAGTGDFCC